MTLNENVLTHLRARLVMAKDQVKRLEEDIAEVELKIADEKLREETGVLVRRHDGRFEVER